MRGPDDSGSCANQADYPYLPTVVNGDDDAPADSAGFCSHPVDSASVSRRKELNRVAAQKCRKRKKEKAQTIDKLAHDLQCHNVELKWKVADLTNKKHHLFELIKAHCGTSGEALVAALMD